MSFYNAFPFNYHSCLTNFYSNVPHCQSNVLPGVLQSKLITSKKHTYGAGYVIQTTKCVSLQMLRYGKSVLKSEHSIVEEIVWKSVFINQ